MTPSTSSPAGEANPNRPPLPSHPAPERTDTDGRMPSSSVRSGGLPDGERERIARGLAEFLAMYPAGPTEREETMSGLHRASPDEVLS